MNEAGIEDFGGPGGNDPAMRHDPGTILVIEDEAQIRKFLRISLEAHGYCVHETRLAVEGIRLCSEIRPDLLILDLGLPDMSGQQVIRRIREWSRLPIIVLSVRDAETTKVEALDAGANDYVTKPFGISELMARIRVVLRDAGDESAAPPVFDRGGLCVD
ncbi:MAG: response regulator, partial [Xanthomonadales bacterium]|nr:response regulator [Xanthomonadales bacterium]